MNFRNFLTPMLTVFLVNDRRKTIRQGQRTGAEELTVA